jgi:CheY-like chemotaxis protein
LAGGVAHDFNNMLTVILGYAAMGKAELREGTPLWNYLAEIEKAGNRSKQITQQLLGFSRQQIIAPLHLNLNDLIKDLIEPLAQLIGEDIEFSFLPGQDLWTVVVDASQVNQILLNLVVNARDAMPSGGKLTIETGNATVSEEDCRTRTEALPGAFVVVAVSDTGVRMPPEVIARIFEPFFTMKGRDEGTGLGLSVVYGIVKQNGGFVNVYSEPGRGSTFRIYLPRMTGEKAKEELSVAVPIAAGSGTVLLVEDNNLVREMVTSSLESIGYKPLVAVSPAHAIELCSSAEGSQIRIVLTDVVMPGMNGMDLRDRIRELRPEVRVLFMSGYTPNVIVKHGILEPGVHFIQKPFTIGELGKRMEEVLG